MIDLDLGTILAGLAAVLGPLGLLVWGMFRSRSRRRHPPVPTPARPSVDAVAEPGREAVRSELEEALLDAERALEDDDPHEAAGDLAAADFRREFGADDDEVTQ